jgi:hypothetical protein
MLLGLPTENLLHRTYCRDVDVGRFRWVIAAADEIAALRQHHEILVIGLLGVVGMMLRQHWEEFRGAVKHVPLTKLFLVRDFFVDEVGHSAAPPSLRACQP